MIDTLRLGGLVLWAIAALVCVAIGGVLTLARRRQPKRRGNQTSRTSATSPPTVTSDRRNRYSHCPRCGTKADGPRSRFCGSCGHALLESDRSVSERALRRQGTSGTRLVKLREK